MPWPFRVSSFQRGATPRDATTPKPTMTTNRIDEAASVSLAVLSLASKVHDYVFDAYGLRKACNVVAEIVLREGCCERRTRIMDAVKDAWDDARKLDEEAETLNRKAREILERLEDALKA